MPFYKALCSKESAKTNKQIEMEKREIMVKKRDIASLFLLPVKC